MEPEKICTFPPPGWFCTRAPGHSGPCAAYPICPQCLRPMNAPGRISTCLITDGDNCRFVELTRLRAEVAALRAMFTIAS